MRKFYISLICITLALFSASTQAATGKGSISGVVNHCERGGVAGMMVYIPGMPHLVITGTDGKFMFDNVVAGDYTLYFMINGRVMNFNKWVEVAAGKASKLGEISFCDKITASMPATRAASAADDASQRPTIVAEGDCRKHPNGTAVNITNGTGLCQNGTLVVNQCNKGFADCDKQPANGCEIDLMNDDENCGSCFNACGDLESCQLGIC